MKKPFRIRIQILIMSCFLVLFSNNTISAGWKAGVARCVITPEQPMWMAGYASRSHTSDSILHDIWAKVLVLEDESGKRSALITTDLLGFPKNLSDNIRDLLHKNYDLSRDRVIMNSSHTHTGPVLRNALLDIYPLDDQELIKIENFSLKLQMQIVELVGKALDSMQPVKIYAENGITRFQVNRRNNEEKELHHQTSLNGPNDFAVPVLKVTNESGDILAIAFGYACHATVLSFYNWSGDYPGFAQLELERLHPGATALFFQCAGADMNPLPRRSVALAQQYGRELAAAVDRVLNEQMRSLSPRLVTAYSEINLPMEAPPTREELLIQRDTLSSKYDKRWADRLIKELDRDDTFITEYPYPVEVWLVGEQLIITLGGELVVEYSIRLKEIFGRDIFVLGYSNDVMAYIPSSRIIYEGGYEGDSSFRVYGLPAKWKPEIEERIIEEIIRLAESIGIKQAQPALTDR